MFLDIIHRLVHFLNNHNVSETGFYIRPQVKPTQLDPIDRASPYNIILVMTGGLSFRSKEIQNIAKNFFFFNFV
jgi:hypothetical protein